MLSLDQFLEDRERNHQQLSDELQRVQTDLQAKREATSLAHSRYVDAQNEIAAIRELWSEVARGTERRTELESMVAQYSSMQTDVMRHQHRLDDLNSELDSLKTQLSAINNRRKTFAARLHQPVLDCGLIVERRTAGAWVGKDSVASAIAGIAALNDERTAALALARARLSETRAMMEVRRRALGQIDESVMSQVNAATVAPRGFLSEVEMSIATERTQMQTELIQLEKEIEDARFHLRRGHALAGNGGTQSALVVHAPFSSERYVVDTRVTRLRSNDTPNDDEVAKAEQVLQLREHVAQVKRDIVAARSAKESLAIRLRVERTKNQAAKADGAKIVAQMEKAVGEEEKMRIVASAHTSKLREDIENLNATVRVQSREVRKQQLQQGRAISPPQRQIGMQRAVRPAIMAS